MLLISSNIFYDFIPYNNFDFNLGYQVILVRSFLKFTGFGKYFPKVFQMLIHIFYQLFKFMGITGLLGQVMIIIQAI